VHFEFGEYLDSGRIHTFPPLPTFERWKESIVLGEQPTVDPDCRSIHTQVHNGALAKTQPHRLRTEQHLGRRYQWGGWDDRCTRIWWKDAGIWGRPNSRVTSRHFAIGGTSS